MDIERNHLQQLPPETGSLSNLTELDSRFNQLSSLPSEIGTLKKLTKLDLSNTPLPAADLPKMERPALSRRRPEMG